MVKTAELRDMQDDELIDQLEGNKEELFNLRFQLATGQLDNVNRIRTVRHDIARILTILRERHLESELEEEIVKADAEALEKGREQLASGQAKGDKLSDMVGTSMPKHEDEPAERAIEKLEEAPE
jgi:large subunit ribosomal protein L29